MESRSRSQPQCLYHAPFGASIFQGDGTETRLNIDFGELGGLLNIVRSQDEVIIQEGVKVKDQLWKMACKGNLHRGHHEEVGPAPLLY